jgi:hypothetical protein
VFDGVLQEFYTLRGYYDTEHAKCWYRYTRKAAMWIDSTNRRHNPQLWSYRFHDLLGLPWADFSNPLLIDLEMAKRLWREKH